MRRRKTQRFRVMEEASLSFIPEHVELKSSSHTYRPQNQGEKGIAEGLDCAAITGFELSTKAKRYLDKWAS